jgi:hypothetical protein
MAWKKHQIQRKPGGAPVRICTEAYLRRSKMTVRHFLLMNCDVIDRIGARRFDLLVGTDEHRGILRLVGSSTGAFLAIPQGKLALRYRIALGFMPDLPDQSSTRACHFGYFDGGVNITLPAVPKIAKAA